MKDYGINRVNKGALSEIEAYFLKELRSILPVLKEELIIKGKKTLEKKDIKDALNRLNEKGSWEI